MLALPPPLKKLHDNLCHAGITRLLHYVGSKNMPFSTKKVKETCTSCKIYVDLKLLFASSPRVNLIKSAQLSVDFKGPLQSGTSKNIYLLQ